jgi:hypothetical protein
MNRPPIVSPQEWDAAHQQLLVKEKAQMRAHDALAAERRRSSRSFVLARCPQSYSFASRCAGDLVGTCAGGSGGVHGRVGGSRYRAERSLGRPGFSTKNAGLRPPDYERNLNRSLATGLPGRQWQREARAPA